MITEHLKSIANKISNKLPKGLSNTKEDMEKTIKSILQDGFSKLHLVQREEFETQVKLLETLRTRVDQLEKKIADLSAGNKKKS